MADLKNIYATLDIGDNYIKAVVAEIHDNRLFVLASSLITSDGIIDGEIDSESALIAKINEAMNELSSKVGVDVNRVVLGIPANKVSISKLYGETYITNDSGVVRSEDLQRAIVDATRKYNVKGYEIVNIIPQRYNVDGYVSELAIGCEASKFGVELLALTAPTSTIYPYLSIVEQAGYEVIDICLIPLAEKYEVLKSRKVAESGIIINVGFSGTSLLISHKGELKGVGNFSLGIKKVVESLIAKFNLHPVEALRLIQDYGFVEDYTGDEELKVKLIDGKYDIILKEELLSYLYHVMSSLVITIKREIEKYNLELYDRIVFTGGTVEIEGFKILCHKVFDGECEMYNPKYLGGRNASFSVVFGLVRYIVDKNTVRGRKDSSIDYDSQVKISTPKKKVLTLPEDSVIGKLFEYFFE